MVPPNAWKERLGRLPLARTVSVEIATQERVTGEVLGPVTIQIEGFAQIVTEVLFVDMQPVDGDYEPLIGYLVLEQSLIAVDMLGHRLVQLKAADLK